MHYKCGLLDCTRRLIVVVLRFPTRTNPIWIFKICTESNGVLKFTQRNVRNMKQKMAVSKRNTSKWRFQMVRVSLKVKPSLYSHITKNVTILQLLNYSQYKLIFNMKCVKCNVEKDQFISIGSS